MSRKFDLVFLIFVLDLEVYISYNLGNLRYLRAVLAVHRHQIASFDRRKLVANVQHFTNQLSLRNILDEVVSHPRQVFARHFVVITAEEEAVVELMELFMALEEVNNLVTNLRNVEII